MFKLNYVNPYTSCLFYLLHLRTLVCIKKTNKIEHSINYPMLKITKPSFILISTLLTVIEDESTF